MAKSDSVDCPACSDPCADFIKDRDGRCKYCDGSGSVTELAELAYEKTLLEIRLRNAEADYARVNAERVINAPVIEAANRWRDNPSDKTEHALAVAIDYAEDRHAATRQAVEKTGGETKAWVAAIVAQGGF